MRTEDKTESTGDRGAKRTDSEAVYKERGLLQQRRSSMLRL